MPVVSSIPGALPRHRTIAAVMLCLAVGGTAAEDIEPRRWTPIPVGSTVVGVAVVHGEGDIAFDPLLKVEDATVEVTTTLVSIIRGLDLFGRSARFDIRLPHQHARWEGLLDGDPRTVDRRGAADPRLRLSVNLIGAPALRGQEFAAYRAEHPVNTVVGAALAVVLPLGEYRGGQAPEPGPEPFRRPAAARCGPHPRALVVRAHGHTEPLLRQRQLPRPFHPRAGSPPAPADPRGLRLPGRLVGLPERRLRLERRVDHRRGGEGRCSRGPALRGRGGAGRRPTREPSDRLCRESLPDPDRGRHRQPCAGPVDPVLRRETPTLRA